MRCRNVGTLDRSLRVIIGLALLSLCVIGPKSLWGLVGLIPLLTGFAGACPIYRLMGKSGCDISPRG